MLQQLCRNCEKLFSFLRNLCLKIGFWKNNIDIKIMVGRISVWETHKILCLQHSIAGKSFFSGFLWNRALFNDFEVDQITFKERPDKLDNFIFNLKISTNII